jgi:hypothetical protein
MRIALAAALVALSLPAAAQESAGLQCHDAQAIAKALDEKYHEAPVGLGLESAGNLVQVYASEDGETWTIVATMPTGVSCIVAAGTRWEALPVGAPA